MELQTDPIQADATAVEVVGRIKWFDTVKGYGFIKPSRGVESDVFLHQSCIRQSGFKVAREGATIVCQVVERSKGYQALRVLELDNSTATSPMEQTSSSSSRFSATPEGPQFEATVKWFNRGKGYGSFHVNPGRRMFLCIWKRCAATAFESSNQGNGSECARATAPRGSLRPRLKFWTRGEFWTAGVKFPHQIG